MEEDIVDPTYQPRRNIKPVVLRRQPARIRKLPKRYAADKYDVSSISVQQLEENCQS